MATAFLQQKRNYLDKRAYKDERWSCAKFERNPSDVNYQNADAKKGDILIFEAPFAEYRVKSAAYEMIKQDRFKVFITNQASNSRLVFSNFYLVFFLFFALISGDFFLRFW